MKRYDSNIGPEIYIPLSIIFLIFFVLALVSENWAGVLILIAAATLLVHTTLNTFYVISNGVLSIRSGRLYRSEININTITRIKEVTDIFGAPATSVYRLEISFNEVQSVAISPKNKTEFINQLLSVNPAILVEPKAI